MPCNIGGILPRTWIQSPFKSVPSRTHGSVDSERFGRFEAGLLCLTSICRLAYADETKCRRCAMKGGAACEDEHVRCADPDAHGHRGYRCGRIRVFHRHGSQRSARPQTRGALGRSRPCPSQRRCDASPESPWEPHALTAAATSPMVAGGAPVCAGTRLGILCDCARTSGARIAGVRTASAS